MAKQRAGPKARASAVRRGHAATVKIGSASLLRDTKRGGKLTGYAGRFSILIDTGTMVRALIIGASGNVNRRIRGGIQFGIGGAGKAGRHVQLTTQTAKGNKRVRGVATSDASIGTIAAYHQSGGGNLPQRKILDVPDQQTRNTMTRFAAQAMNKSLRAASAKPTTTIIR